MNGCFCQYLQKDPITYRFHLILIKQTGKKHLFSWHYFLSSLKIEGLVLIFKTKFLKADSAGMRRKDSCLEISEYLEENIHDPEGVTQRCSVKKVSLRICKHSLENNCAGILQYY